MRVESQTPPAVDQLYGRVAHIVTEVEWALYAPQIAEIERHKRERNALVLAHHYQTPEIYHTVADVIVMCGVHFMAETAKLLNPEKVVLLPDLAAGCSLAASIDAADVRELRRRHPGVPVVTYVNTSAAVKAESDICCTSANAVAVVESLGAPRVIFLPDEYLAHYVASQTSVEIIDWKGHCEVHERFTAREIASIREDNPGVTVLAHPECPPDVLAVSDFVGSTTGMLRFVEERRPQSVAMITECSMSDNVAGRFPEISFVRPCNLCPHMKRITLPKIARALERLEPQIDIAPEVAARARRAVERMVAIG